MNMNPANRIQGYTIIELMVTMVLVSALAAFGGMFVVKLLTLQEQNREEAYIRERLVDICGVYADHLSIGSSVSNNLSSHQWFDVKYRQETGGVSLETGRVSHVAFLKCTQQSYTILNKSYTNVIASTFDGDGVPLKLSNEFWGSDTPLMTVKDLRINDNPVNLRCRIDPLNDPMGGTAIWKLQVRADYAVKNEDGDFIFTNAAVERIVRLWNHN